MKNLFLTIVMAIVFNKGKDNQHFVDYYMVQANNQKLSYNQRLVFCDKLRVLLKQKNNDSLNRENLFKLSNSLIRINQWEKLKKVSLFIANKSKGCDTHLARAYRNLGISYENLSVNDSAFHYYAKSLKIYQLKKDFLNICRLYQDEALVQYYINDYLGSDQSLINALKVAKNNNLKTEMFNTLSLLGINSNELGNFVEASTYYIKAQKILEENTFKNEDELQLKNLSFIAYNFYKQGRVYAAIDIYKKLLSRPHIKSDFPFFHALLLDNLGKAYIDVQKVDDVQFYFDQAASIRDSLSIEQGRNFNRLYLSQYYAAVKDTTQAIKYAKEALRLSQDFKAPNDMLVCLKQLLLVDKDHALDYSKDYIRISDSMQKLERVTRNKFAKIAYETEEITQEKDRAETQRSFFLTLAILVTAFGLLLGIIFYQRAKQKELVFAQNQQQAKEEIYELIQDRQTKLDQGRQIEKKRIARELHDGIMNKLASTRFNLYAIKNSNDPETIKKCLSYIDNIQEIEKEIRDISHDLTKEQFLEKDSFKRILTTFFDEQQAVQEAKLHIDIEKSIDWETIESNKKINLYRILQEALLNIQKHAQAQHVFIHITQTEAGLHVEIHDDGKGYSEADNAIGIGLQNIKTRVKDCLGFFKMKSQPGKGTSLDINFPLSKNLS